MKQEYRLELKYHLEAVDSMVDSKKKRPSTSYKQVLPEADEISFIDATTNDRCDICTVRWEDELKKIHGHIENALKDIEKLANYTLNELDFSVGVSAGIVGATLHGGITLRYEREKSPVHTH